MQEGGCNSHINSRDPEFLFENYRTNRKTVSSVLYHPALQCFSVMVFQVAVFIIPLGAQM